MRTENTIMYRAITPYNYILYGADCRNMANEKNGEKETDCFGKKNPTVDLGIVKKNTETGEWRMIQRNKELEGLFHKQNILDTIQSRRLQLMKSESTITHGNCREPRRKETPWTPFYEMGRCGKERRRNL